MDALILYTIYDHPKDFPHHYVVRPHAVTPGDVMPHGFSCLYNTLEEARADCIDNGADTCLMREPDDDPVIIETWL